MLDLFFLKLVEQENKVIVHPVFSFVCHNMGDKSVKIQYNFFIVQVLSFSTNSKNYEIESKDIKYHQKTSDCKNL